MVLGLQPPAQVEPPLAERPHINRMLSAEVSPPTDLSPTLQKLNERGANCNNIVKLMLLNCLFVNIHDHIEKQNTVVCIIYDHLIFIYCHIFEFNTVILSSVLL